MSLYLTGLIIVESCLFCVGLYCAWDIKKHNKLVEFDDIMSCCILLPFVSLAYPIIYPFCAMIYIGSCLSDSIDKRNKRIKTHNKTQRKLLQDEHVTDEEIDQFLDEGMK